jgi:hypothetical protein
VVPPSCNKTPLIWTFFRKGRLVQRSEMMKGSVVREKMAKKKLVVI